MQPLGPSESPLQGADDNHKECGTHRANPEGNANTKMNIVGQLSYHLTCNHLLLEEEKQIRYSLLHWPPWKLAEGSGCLKGPELVFYGCEHVLQTPPNPQGGHRWWNDVLT